MSVIASKLIEVQINSCSSNLANQFRHYLSGGIRLSVISVQMSGCHIVDKPGKLNHVLGENGTLAGHRFRSGFSSDVEV